MLNNKTVKLFLALSAFVLFYTIFLKAEIIPHNHVIKKLTPTTILHVVQSNITNIKVDAIVNAANKELARGSGVCGAIFQAAEGVGTQLQDYLKNYWPEGITPGQAILTPSFYLEKKGITYIIHAVGPIYRQYTDKKQAAQILHDTYVNSLDVAHKYNLHSIAFPFISSGIYGYPIKEASIIALQSIIDYVQTENPILNDIYVVLFSKSDFDVFVKALSTLV